MRSSASNEETKSVIVFTAFSIGLVVIDEKNLAGIIGEIIACNVTVKGMVMINTQSKNDQLLNLFAALQNELEKLGSWSEVPPAPDAFLSQLPFSYDTMSLPEWIQFIFLPKMNELIERGGVLPQRCGIEPMAQEFFKDRSMEAVELLRILSEIDRVLGGLAEN